MNKTIGVRLKNKRNELKFSVEKISEELKIRPEYIRAIESDDYSVFTSEVYAKGFIKSYSKFLGIDLDTFNAVYRRDRVNSRLKSNSHNEIPDSSNKKIFQLTDKKLKYIFFILLVFFLTFTLLSIVNKAFEPPVLNLYYPATLSANTQNHIDYYDKTVSFTGEISPNTVLKINGISYSLKPDNTFETDLFPITEDENVFKIEAVSNVGIVSTIDLTLLRKTNEVQVAEGITGAIQIEKDNSFIKVDVDDNEYINGLFFENDSIPIIGKNSVKIEADRPDNIKIVINGEEYKILDESLKLTLIDNHLTESN